jgi:hypothetical protein
MNCSRYIDQVLAAFDEKIWFFFPVELQSSRWVEQWLSCVYIKLPSIMPTPFNRLARFAHVFSQWKSSGEISGEFYSQPKKHWLSGVVPSIQRPQFDNRRSETKFSGGMN